LPGNANSRVVLSSVGTKWNDVEVEQHHFPGGELADVMFKQNVIVVIVGHAITCEFRKEGGFQHVFKARGAISFFPSHQPFFLRLKVEKGMFANVLFLALDPALVSRIAAGLQLDSDHIELVEQHGGTDPTLHHIVMALQAGVQTGNPVDRMYGGGTINSAGRPPTTQIRRGSARAEKAVRWVAARKARACCRIYSRSSGHRLDRFRDCSGRLHESLSLRQARVRKAKELLATGKFTISEAAYHVGFVDQSHLTRHFKRIFARTP
jgi:AraC family transcriptional regulator